MRVKDKAIHEVSGLSITDPIELPGSGGCRYQDLTITDDHGNSVTTALFLTPNCKGFVVGVNLDDPTIAPCDRPFPTSVRLHA